MKKKKTELELAQKKAEKIAKQTNIKIEELGEKTGLLSDNLNELQSVFDDIRGIPSNQKLEIEKFKKIRINWTQQVKKIATDYKTAETKAVGSGVAGAGAGVAVVAIGPSVAMGLATTFGVASTGTAISALSGAAATNASLAWLGGGALAVGGGGMGAGATFLALAGPVGWSIAGVALLSSGLLVFKSRSEKKRLEDIFISISYRDEKSYKLALVEIKERIGKIIDETKLLSEAITASRSYGIDYDTMSEQQQYSLITFVNLMNSSTQLLVNPILGLQQKYTEEDFNDFIEKTNTLDRSLKSIYVYLANLLYKIKLDDTDKKLLYKSFRKNKGFLNTMGCSKQKFDLSVINTVESALKTKYKS